MLKPYIQKAAEWTGWTLIISLAQFWYDLATKYFKGTVDWFDILKTGPLLFVILAVVVGIAVDFFLDPKKSGALNFKKRLTFVGLPAFVIGFVLWAYALSVGGLALKEQQETFVALNFFALTLCTVYSIGAKAYLYFE